MWTRYFNFVKLRRGRVITPSHGEIDFSRDDITIETCKELYESDFPYLEITPEGKKELYGIGLEMEVEKSDPVFEPFPPVEENPDQIKKSFPIKKEGKRNKKSIG